MSTEIDSLIDDLMLILGEVVIGTESNPRKLRRIELALERARDHGLTRVPRSQLGEVGGSSSPVELQERQEDDYVGRRALKDQRELRVMLRRLAATTRDLRARVVYHTGIVDYGLLPADPGCRSCARTATVRKQTMGGHFADVYDKAEKHGLCEWCWKHARADGIEKGVKGLGDLPPVEACHLYHTQSPRAAGLFMARLARDKERKQKKAS